MTPFRSARPARAVLCAGALALCAAGVAYGANPPNTANSTSIAGVKRGMTETQVRAILGKPSRSAATEPTNEFLTWTPYKLTVSFLRKTTRRAFKVVSVETTSSRFVTAKGIKVGSTFAAVRDAYPTFKCRLERSDGSVPTVAISKVESSDVGNDLRECFKHYRGKGDFLVLFRKPTATKSSRKVVGLSID